MSYFSSVGAFIAAAPHAYWSSCLVMVLLAYVLGSVSFAVVVSSVFRLSDPRTYGSKNPGATNVLRNGHKLAAALTLLGDACKGALAVLLAFMWVRHKGWDEVYGFFAVALAGYAVFLGHLFPVFFRFQGGKGVATAAGVLWAFYPLLGLSASLTWLAAAALLGYSSLAALLSALLAPIYAFYFLGWAKAWPLVSCTVLLSLWLVYRHRRNISRLIHKQEERIGSRKGY